MCLDALDRAMAAPKEWPITTTEPGEVLSITSSSHAPYQDKRPRLRFRSPELSPGCPGTSNSDTRWPAATRAVARGSEAAALKLVPGTNTTVVPPAPADTTWVCAPPAPTTVRSCGTSHPSSCSWHQRRMSSRPAALR